MLVVALFISETVDLSPLLYSFIATNIMQSMWSIAFSKEMLILSTYLLAGIVLGLWYSYNELMNIKAFLHPAAFLAFYVPISFHYNWTFIATLLNVNLAVVSFNAPCDVELTAGIMSLWLAVAVAVERAVWFGDLLSLLVAGAVSNFTPHLLNV